MRYTYHGVHNDDSYVRHKSLWKLGALLALSLGSLILGMSNPPNAYAQNSNPSIPMNRLETQNSTNVPENRLKINSSGKNLTNSAGNNGANQVENGSSKSYNPDNSGAISFPHSYDKYKKTNDSITSNLANYHNGLENKYLGKDALKFNVKSNDSTINVGYQNAMSYTTYEKDNNGNWQKKVIPISVTMRLQRFNFYPSEYWSSTPNVFVSRNFGSGIYYNGISNMQVQYTYYDANTNQPINLDKNAFMSVHGLDGIANPDGSYLNNNGTNMSGRNRLIPYYYTATWMMNHNNTAANNEKFFSGNNGLNKYKQEIFDSDSERDTYGKFVAWQNGDVAFTSSDSKIGQTGILDNNNNYLGTVNTGKENSAYSSDRDDSSHALTFPIGKAGQDSFLIGSSAGYGNFSTSSNVNVTKPKNDQQQQPNTPIKKSVDKTEIHHEGEDLTYTLQGNLPIKTPQTKTNYYTFPTYSMNKHGKIVPSGYGTGSYQVPIHTHDYYNLTDKIPDATSVTSVTSSGALSATQQGNQIVASANNSQMQSNSGGAYTIKVHVKADKLPQPGANGWSDTPNDNGYYKFSNQASANVQLYDNDYTDSSNQASTQIKRYHGTIWHYDFDNQENGDFDFMNHGPDGDGDFGYNNNFDPDQGVLKKDTVYGYEGDTKSVNILSDAYKNGNPQWHYRYAYGDQSQANITFNDPGDDGDGTTQDFYFPYIVPRSRLTNSLITVDTDKKANGLPFTLDMKGESFLYRNFNDYNGTNVTVNVTAPDGSILWTQTKPLTSLLTEGQHAINWTQWQGKLDTSKLNVPDGSKVPLGVQVTSNNPQLIQQDQDDSTATFGFTANNNQIGSKSFDAKNNATNTSPQETLKYKDMDQPRTISEMLSINQARNASGKTGYGLRQGNDLTLQYAGNMNVKNYLDNGTGLDYDFSSAYNQSNSGINYAQDPRNHTYNVPNQSNDQGTQQQQGGLADRFNQTNRYDGSGYSKLTNTSGYDTNNLDTYNQMDSNDQTIVNSVNSDMPLSYSQYLHPGSFQTTYDFAPRFTERDSGSVYLTQGMKDALAKNRNNPDYNGIDAGQRMYTPYFMPLGQYDTYYAKSDTDDTHRLGANYYDIDENRPTNFYGHMYLTANSSGGTSDEHDELSIQPIIAHQQTVNGFSNQENQWLKDQSGYFSK